MKLNTVLKNIVNSPKKVYVGIILIWTIIGVFIFSPLTIFVTEGILEQSSVNAVTNTDYTLSKIDANAYSNVIDAEDLQNKAFLSSSQQISSQSSITDGRAVALRKFLLKQNSPLMPYANLIVSEADRNGLDWRLLVSISGVESRFCKVLPFGSFNGWGWRGGPGGDWQRFGSYDYAVRYLTERLAVGYGTHLTPYDIEPTYCPPCYQSHNWARAVTQFMRQINQELENSKVSQ